MLTNQEERALRNELERMDGYIHRLIYTIMLLIVVIVILCFILPCDSAAKGISGGTSRSGGFEAYLGLAALGIAIINSLVIVWLDRQITKLWEASSKLKEDNEVLEIMCGEIIKKSNKMHDYVFREL